MDDQNETAFQNAMLLFAVYDENGKAQPLSQAEAAKLLSKIKSVNTGSETFDLHIPEAALRAAGVNMAMWDKAQLKSTTIEGTTYREVPYDFATRGVLPALELLAGKKFNDLQVLRADIDAARTDRIHR